MGLWLSWPFFPGCITHNGNSSRLDFPGRRWKWISAGEAGLSREAVEAFSRLAGGDGCIAYRGRMVHAWGNTTDIQEIASAAKPFYTHFVLRARQQGAISSLDAPVADLREDLRVLSSTSDPSLSRITWRHLLSQTSGYGVETDPGEAYFYNDLQTGLLVETLVKYVYACGFDSADSVLLDKELGGFVGFQDKPTMNSPRSRPGRIRISVRDLARFGHLYLSEGRWQNRQVLSENLVRTALNSPVPEDIPQSEGTRTPILPNAHAIGTALHPEEFRGHTSFFWWINQPGDSGAKYFENAPPRTFAAIGHGGVHVMLVIPERDLVIVRLGGANPDMSVNLHGNGRLLIHSALSLLFGE